MNVHLHEKDNKNYWKHIHSYYQLRARRVLSLSNNVAVEDLEGA